MHHFSIKHSVSREVFAITDFNKIFSGRAKARCDSSHLDAAVCPRRFYWIKPSIYNTCHFMCVQLTKFLFTCLPRCHMYCF